MRRWVVLTSTPIEKGFVQQKDNRIFLCSIFPLSLEKFILYQLSNSDFVRLVAQMFIIFHSQVYPIYRSTQTDSVKLEIFQARNLWDRSFYITRIKWESSWTVKRFSKLGLSWVNPQSLQNSNESHKEMRNYDRNKSFFSVG